ncbi:MAG: HIT family protein, partial [bacterium]|nr:HIT family protein [bacterium]
MDCIFCKIAEGEIPSHAIWEDAHFLAFLDINPLRKGHTLVIPKHHEVDLFDMKANDYQNLLAASKIVANKLKHSTDAKRIGLVVEGFEVDHVHIHLIPLTEAGQLDPKFKKEATQEELTSLAEAIRTDKK